MAWAARCERQQLEGPVEVEQSFINPRSNAHTHGKVFLFQKTEQPVSNLIPLILGNEPEISPDKLADLQFAPPLGLEFPSCNHARQQSLWLTQALVGCEDLESDEKAFHQLVGFNKAF